jgi:hypothetical protein
MWVQNENNKPVWLNINDKILLSKLLKKGSFKWKNKSYIVCSNMPEFEQVINIFYPDQTWEHYKKLKDNIKHFKKTGTWLND